MTRTRRLTAAGLLAVAAVLTLSLTACDPNQTGAAAIVDQVRITEAEVNQAASEAIAAADRVPPGQGQPIDRTQVLKQNTERLINSQLIAIAAAQEGVTVSQSEVDKLLQQASYGTDQLHFEGNIAVQAGVPPQAISSFARDFLLRQKLGQQLDPKGGPEAQMKAANAKISQVAEQVGVTVSPRYGTWDAATLAIGGPVNDLSVTPSPSPTDSSPPAEQ